MKTNIENTELLNQEDLTPYQIKLPGFINDNDIGLGDLIKKATTYFGIRPCGSCESRATVLNRWMVFTAEKSK